MKQKMYIFLAVLALMLTVNCNIVTAQVAIGGDGSVEAGATLDLSQQGNATGGLLLPKVSALPAAGSALRKAGMLIYNTVDNTVYTYDADAGQWVAGASTTLLSDYATTASMNSALAAKQNNLTAGAGITISGSTIATTVSQGPQGPEGPQGETGATGPKGNDGPEGPSFNSLADGSNPGLLSADDYAKLQSINVPVPVPGGGNSVLGSDGYTYALTPAPVDARNLTACPAGFTAVGGDASVSKFCMQCLNPDGRETLQIWGTIGGNTSNKVYYSYKAGNIDHTDATIYWLSNTYMVCRY